MKKRPIIGGMVNLQGFDVSRGVLFVRIIMPEKISIPHEDEMLPKKILIKCEENTGDGCVSHLDMFEIPAGNLHRLDQNTFEAYVPLLRWKNDIALWIRDGRTMHVSVILEGFFGESKIQAETEPCTYNFSNLSPRDATERD